MINNTLKFLCIGKEREIATRPFVKFTGFTDTGALSLASSVAANTSMECLVIQWFSTDPDGTMGECVKHSSLKTLNLVIDSGIHLGKVPVSQRNYKCGISVRQLEEQSSYCHWKIVTLKMWNYLCITLIMEYACGWLNYLQDLQE